MTVVVSDTMTLIVPMITTTIIMIMTHGSHDGDTDDDYCNDNHDADGDKLTNKTHMIIKIF